MTTQCSSAYSKTTENLCLVSYTDLPEFNSCFKNRCKVFYKIPEINYIRKSASKSSYEGLENIINGCEIAKSRIKANVNFDLAIELMLLNIKEN